MSTVCPTILNWTCFADARSESERAFCATCFSSARWRGDLALLALSVAALAFLALVSAIATLFGWLVWVTSRRQVYCGSALEISYIRCDQGEREHPLPVMIAICW